LPGQAPSGSLKRRSLGLRQKRRPETPRPAECAIDDAHDFGRLRFVRVWSVRGARRFFASPFSASFWRHFGEFWGFLWFWERGTLCALVWGAFVVAALIAGRLPVGHVAAPRLILAGSLAGLFTSGIVGLLARILGSSPFIWLGFGAFLAVALNVSSISWIGSRSSEKARLEG